MEIMVRLRKPWIGFIGMIKPEGKVDTQGVNPWHK